ncbi:MAG: universal stress protein [Saprospiraceae bacterium]
MKKIIVPTDFSPAATNAFAYAKALAVHTNRPLKIVHVTHPGSNVSVTMPDISILRETQEARMKQFLKRRTEENTDDILTKLELESEVIIGFPAEELVKMSKQDDCDFIIMGTTGEKGLLNNLLGTISSAVSQKAHCPVWLIPPNKTFTGIDNLLYAGNYESADKNMLHEIIDISATFDSVVHLVHVHDPEENKEDWKFEELMLKQLFREAVPKNFPLDLHTVKRDSFWRGINEYAVEKNVDLIVMVTRHRTLWERLTHTSMTKEMILNAEIPLLVLHLED